MVRLVRLFVCFEKTLYFMHSKALLFLWLCHEPPTLEGVIISANKATTWGTRGSAIRYYNK